MAKVSIITPIWCDTEEKVIWLDEMIRSVQAQTLVDWELILVNDKSPMSLDTVKLMHSTDTRLRWLENAKNFGVAATRNTAVAIANSECILPLDSDDMLANPDALEFMYDAWLMDNTKTVYGNVQLYREIAPNTFERSKVFQLASYSFDGAMNLEFGIMPVSTMHSKEAHYRAGGWKSALEYGREDLEYWIACGKAGYCGLKINHSTLLYRKHEQSRDYKLKFENQELKNMQLKIKELHNDIYNGRFPMACCGKGNSGSAARSGPAQSPDVISQQNEQVTKVTELQDYSEQDKEWVAYQGAKKGRFDVLVRGPSNLPSSYAVLGTGHHFQIHKNQRSFFEQRQHLGFRINVSDPRGDIVTPKSEPEPVPRVVEVAKPELSTLVRLDNDTIETAIVSPPSEVIIEPNPAQSFSATMFFDKPTLSLDSLGLTDSLTNMLARDWTIESLAMAETSKLTRYKGIGSVRAKRIIEKARKLIESQ